MVSIAPGHMSRWRGHCPQTCVGQASWSRQWAQRVMSHRWLQQSSPRPWGGVIWSRGPHHSYFWAMWLWASHLGALRLYFFIWKWGSNFNFSRLLPGLER